MDIAIRYTGGDKEKYEGRQLSMCENKVKRMYKRIDYKEYVERTSIRYVWENGEVCMNGTSEICDFIRGYVKEAIERYV